MKYLDGFRNPDAARRLQAEIAAVAARLPPRRRPLHVMEVCGSHTMAIARYGLRDLLPPGIELISGPGCPVCVTDAGYIDAAVELARRGLTIATFGDMLNVPGSAASLADVRAAGARIEVCYSPLAALDLACRQPDREVVFLAIGFETTVAPVVSLIAAARRDGIRNLSLLVAFKLIPPALRALAADPEIHVAAFLCPAHVSAIIGADAYQPFVRDFRVPCVIAGFEPLDILLGVKGILEQLAAGEARVENQYSRVVRPGGNPLAQAVIARHLEPADASWRGLGVIPASGLKLRPQAAEFDAEQRHGLRITPGTPDRRCRCGDVLKGKRRPPDCPLFGNACTPEHPVGPCMVSSEGSCAASYKYSQDRP
ncbi:MAG: Hydrogenase isoenzymes formation protein HypD [Lentisphaerae bacterium ADurb.BinA184]|nr:MAG: Hydrogenase isoenzymes formation protein HypD [Lentisphaerae bacterium ADurb.BinA184]